MTHNLTVEESERQSILMALAHLSLQRPGWDYMLNLIACKMDNVVADRAQMYDKFRTMAAPPRSDTIKQLSCDDPRVTEMVLHAWVGEDELGSGEVGIKAGFVPAGCIPLVACKEGKVDQRYIVEQMQAQSKQYGKVIRLAQFIFNSVEIELKPF